MKKIDKKKQDYNGQYYKTLVKGFPGGSVAESTCQCRRHGVHPWSEEIPPAKEQLSPCTTAIEPEL